MVSKQNEPTVNVVVSGGRRKLHYLYPDSTELIEELDQNTNELLVRKWKRPRDTAGMTGDPTWDYEVGEEPVKFNPENDLLAVSA